MLQTLRKRSSVEIRGLVFFDLAASFRLLALLVLVCGPSITSARSDDAVPEIRTPEKLTEAMWTGIREQNAKVATDAVIALSHNHIDKVRSLDIQVIFAVYALLQKDDSTDELRFSFLQALYESGYTPGKPYRTPDEFTIEYAIMAADRGQTEVLKAAVLSLRDPGVMLRVRIDRRFDAIRQDGSLEAFLDLEEATRREIDRLAELKESHPQLAMAHVYYSRILAAAWRFGEALDAIDSVALKIRLPFFRNQFDDADWAKNWVLAEYSHALERVKYQDDAAHMFVESVEAPENKKRNASQTINLAARLVHGGRADLAIELIETLSDADTSDYGKMWLQNVYVCAGAMSNSVDDFSQNLAYMIEHEFDNPGALIQALLCTGDMNRTAEFVIRRLESTKRRSAALVFLQFADSDWQSDRMTHEHADVEVLTPGHILRHRFDELRQREDVRQTIELVGRLEVVPLHDSVWFRY